MIESVRTPESRVQIKGQTGSKLCLYRQPATSLLTRSDELRARTRDQYSLDLVLNSRLTSLTLVSTSFAPVPDPQLTSLPLVSTSFALVPDSQLTSRDHTGQGTEETDSAQLRYHVCSVSVSNAQHTFLETVQRAVRTWMSDVHASESSLSMSRLVYRLKAVLWQCGWPGTNIHPSSQRKTKQRYMPARGTKKGTLYSQG